VEQLNFFSIPSPCIGVCQSDEKGYCIGCLRSRNERFNWISLSDGQKSEVIKLALQRKRRRQFSLFKANEFQELYEKASKENSLFDAESEDSFSSIIQNPDLIDKLSPEKLDLFWWFLNTLFFPFLISCIATTFMENRELIASYFVNVYETEEIKDIASKVILDIKVGDWAIVTAKNLNFREGPTLTAPIIRQLEIGETIEVIDDMGNDWLYVRSMKDDVLYSGWVFRRYVVFIKVARI